ncbi:hypothetical protein BGZ76_006825, partial [Entomortierella beljakovae]
MTYEILSKLMIYLERQDIIKKHTYGLCLWFQAFASTAFTLWTRCDELLELTAKSLKRGKSQGGHHFIDVTLLFRKTNQADVNK